MTPDVGAEPGLGTGEDLTKVTTYSPGLRLLDASLEVSCPASCDLGTCTRQVPGDPGRCLLPRCFSYSLLPCRFYPTPYQPKLLPGRELFGFFLHQ